MYTKTDRRSKIRFKRKYKRVPHWIWARKPSFLHLEKLQKNKKHN